MAGLDPVADWDCIVRKLVRVADGRVKPGHDVGASLSPAMTWGARVGIFGAWYNVGSSGPIRFGQTVAACYSIQQTGVT